MKAVKMAVLGMLLLGLSLAGQAQAQQRCGNCGIVMQVSEKKEDGAANGLGAVAGAVAGAYLGSKYIGKGKGKTVGAILGGLGGAWGGKKVEGMAKAQSFWQTDVKMEDGSLRSARSQSAPSWQTGQQVAFDPSGNLMARASMEQLRLAAQRQAQNQGQSGFYEERNAPLGEVGSSMTGDARETMCGILD